MKQTDYAALAQSVADRLLARTHIQPRVMLILGSGLGGLADNMEDATHGTPSSMPITTAPA